jgi:hypothetical protein
MQFWEYSKQNCSVANKRRTWPPQSLKEATDVARIASRRWQCPKARRAIVGNAAT